LHSGKGSKVLMPGSIYKTAVFVQPVNIVQFSSNCKNVSSDLEQNAGFALVIFKRKIFGPPSCA
jgi:hypothetical protein